MTIQLEQSLHHANVAFVNCDVQRCLASFVARVQVRGRRRQLLDHAGLVSEGGVMHGAIAVLVLDLHVRVVLEKHADHFEVPVYYANKTKNASVMEELTS